MKKANLRLVLLIAGSILVCIALLAYFVLPTFISSEYQWITAPLAAVIGLATSVSVTPMCFSIGDAVAKRKDYSKLPKVLAEDGRGRFYFQYKKEPANA